MSRNEPVLDAPAAGIDGGTPAGVEAGTGIRREAVPRRIQNADASCWLDTLEAESK